MLDRNLADVESVTNTVDSYRDNLQTLLTLPDAVKMLNAAIRSTIAYLDLDPEDMKDLNADQKGKILKGLDRDLKDEALKKLIDEVHPKVEGLQRRIRDAGKAAGELRDRLSTVPTGPEIRKGLERRLLERVEGSRVKVASIRKQLSGEAPDDSAWSDYLDVASRSQEVFTEYFDLLGGVALRAAGFDQGVCAIADELIEKLQPAVDWRSLTLPARETAVDETVARIIRMAFPEWTGWALPLTAHEIGHIFVKDKILKESDKPNLQQVFLADVFATYMMGPAFVCAEVFIRLDPSVKRDSGRNSKRVQVMLATLEYMDSEASQGQPYAEIRALLQQEWDHALAQSGTKKVRENPANVSDWVTVVAKKVTRASSLVADDWWTTVIPWSEKLRDKRASEIKPDLTQAELRNVLNAAWHCRLTTDVAEGVIHDQALELWKMVVETMSHGRGKPATSAAAGYKATTQVHKSRAS